MLLYVLPTCTLSQQPLVTHCKCNAWWISRFPVWTVAIKRKGLKVENAGVFPQRHNLVIMDLCTSLCSAVLCCAELLYGVNAVEKQDPFELSFLNSVSEDVFSPLKQLKSLYLC